MKKIIIAVLTSICMSFIGLVLGVLLDETFGGSSFTFAPVLSIIFSTLTMGGVHLSFTLMTLVNKTFCGGNIIMDNREIIEKWLSVFGKGVDKQLIEDHVTSYGNLLWHLFTWGNVSCIKGDEARAAFDALDYTEAIRFYDGYANNIEGVSVIEKISAKKVDKDRKSDVYIVAKDFSWTYVRTHEDYLGPYLCVKK